MIRVPGSRSLEAIIKAKEEECRECASYLLDEMLAEENTEYDKGWNAALREVSTVLSAWADNHLRDDEEMKAKVAINAMFATKPETAGEGSRAMQAAIQAADDRLTRLEEQFQDLEQNRLGDHDRRIKRLEGALREPPVPFAVENGIAARLVPRSVGEFRFETERHPEDGDGA